MSNKFELNATIAMLRTALANEQAQVASLRARLGFKDKELRDIEARQPVYRKLLGRLYWRKK